jgi:hypothetical protein
MCLGMSKPDESQISVVQTTAHDKAVVVSREEDETQRPESIGVFSGVLVSYSNKSLNIMLQRINYYGGCSPRILRGLQCLGNSTEKNRIRKQAGAQQDNTQPHTHSYTVCGVVAFIVLASNCTHSDCES